MQGLPGSGFGDALRLLSVDLLLLSGQSDNRLPALVEESEKRCSENVDLLVETAIEFADARVQIFGVFVKAFRGSVKPATFLKTLLMLLSRAARANLELAVSIFG